jgi:hypothetical protein
MDSAHQEQIEARMANLKKIQYEMNIDDFLTEARERCLPSTDEKENSLNSDDVTNRFDHVFLFGDRKSLFAT